MQAMFVLAVLFSVSTIHARPIGRVHKSVSAPLTFLAQTNTVSNVEFWYTNRGELFNSGIGQNEGLFWPRGSGNSYLFGSGLWLAAKKLFPNSAEVRDGWSLAGSISGSYFNSTVNSFFANSDTKRLFLSSTGDTLIYARQDTDASFHTFAPHVGNVTAIAELSNGTLLIGGSKGLVSGSELGPWATTSISSSVTAISSFGVVDAGVSITRDTIYTPNANGSRWTARYKIGNIRFLSSLPNNVTILAGISTTLLLSKDTGNTWDSVFSPAPIMGAALGSDGSIIVATRSGVLQTSDQGANWIPHNTGLLDSTIRFIRSDDGVNFVLATDSGVFTTVFQNGNLGTWNLKNAGVRWQGAVVEAVVDEGGSLHVATDSEGQVFTQWKSKTLVPGLQPLVEVGYNPNSGAGWYAEGETNQFGLWSGTDGADPDAKYISYVSPRYDKTSGKFMPGSSSIVPPPFYAWPVWDSSSSKTFLRNDYFGDYISDVTMRNTASIEAQNPQFSINGKTPAPAVVSQEDIVNLYSDADTANNPEFAAGTGYPFGLDIQEVIYSWSYGSYRDMIFVRYKITNSSNDTLFDSWIAPAFDPDLDAAVGGASNDAVSYVNDSLVKAAADSAMVSELREPYRSDPTKLNMGVAWRNVANPPNGKQYGWMGISFLESPVIDSHGNIIPNDDSAALQGYGPNSLFQNNQLGLVTFRDWIILNDPPNAPLRYSFVSNGEKDVFNGVYQDQRILMATGPFTLLPGQSVEATVALTFAHVSDTSYKQNFGALLLLTDLAHHVFGEVDSNNTGGSTNYFVNNFQVAQQSSVKIGSTLSGLTMNEPYPNPFSTNCTISYRNPVAGTASAILTDVLGRTVRSLSLGEVSVGEHTFTIAGADLPAGDYHITLTVGSETSSQMTVHLR